MLIDDVSAHFGSQGKAAKALGVVPSAPSKWRVNGKHVPVNVALLAEKLSKGKLKFDKEYYQAELLAKHKAKG